jgi:trigger factor
VPELENALVGLAIGETRDVTFDRGEEEPAGQVAVTVKEIKEKVLPPLDDELARAASEFDTLDELRAEIHDRLRAHLEEDVEAQFRAAAADALVRASDVQAAGPLVEARTRELVNGLVRSVERRGIPFETYLSMTNTDPQALLERMRAEAAQSVGRELVLEAVADQLGIDVPDEEVEQLRHSGGFERLREDLRLRAALDRVAAEVKPIAPEVAEAREAIWTPDKEKPKAETKLWTPGSKEHA